MIIGLTGKNGSGKGEVSKFLVSAGFVPFSLSDVLRAELKKQKKSPTRENLIVLGTELRQQRGLGVLAQLALDQIEVSYNYVIDSIRHPEEVKTLQKHPQFFLINVEADPKIRFERMLKRDRAGDPKNFEDFLVLEKREEKSEKSSGQQILATLKMADFEISNNTRLEDLQQKLILAIQKISKKVKRPSWDRYFMDIAYAAASRANCIKRKVAAVIIKDKRIIATGYNGTPRSVENCDAGGCPRCFSFAKSGTKLDECLCSHAEENAIVQSAYHGVSIKGATLYTTFSPCLNCSKMIVNAGILEVVYQSEYSVTDSAFRLLKEAGVKLRKI